MATKKQLNANKKNAARSTGPRTPDGKAKVAQNAVKHGMTAASPVILGLEREEDWQDFCDGVLADLAPEGRIEVVLAQRVAQLLWRLQRVTNYEAGVINVGQEEVEGTFKGLDKKLKEAIVNRDLAQSRVVSSKKTIAFLESLATRKDNEKVEGADARASLETAQTACVPPVRLPNIAEVMGLPPEARKNPWEWDGWTAGLVRQMMATLISEAKGSTKELMARCLQDLTELGQEQGAWGRESQDLIEGLTCRRDLESRLRRNRLLPDEKTLAKIARHEGHLGKEFNRALQELRRIQEVRRGG
jgi:hypothetical protein